MLNVNRGDIIQDLLVHLYIMIYLDVYAVEGSCIDVITLIGTRRRFNGDLGAVHYTKDIWNTCM